MPDHPKVARPKGHGIVHGTGYLLVYISHFIILIQRGSIIYILGMIIIRELVASTVVHSCLTRDSSSVI